MFEFNNYDGFAEIYDTITTPEFKTSVSFFKKFAKKANGKKLLELGCGTGKYSVRFAKLKYDVTAIDLSEKMLEIARHKAKQEKAKINFLQKDFVDLDFYEKCDIAVSFDSLNHVLSKIEMEKVLSNCFNSLKNGGIFVFDYMTPKNFSNKNKFGGYGGKAGEKYFIWEDFCEKNSWFLELTVFEKKKQNENQYLKKVENIYGYTMPLKSLKKLLEKAGFSEVMVFGENGKSRPNKNSEFWYFTAKK